MSATEKREQWTILKDGAPVLTFTAMLDTSIQSDSSIPEELLEKGSFAAYNRTQYSDTFRVKLAIEGDSSELQRAQETLKELKSGTDTFSLVTPDFEHENIALESFDYIRNRSQGSGILIVDMRMKEIREIETATGTLTVAKCRNASNVSKQKTGRTQTQEATDGENKSVLKAGTDFLGGRSS